MLRLRLRSVSDAGLVTQASRVIETDTIDYTSEVNGSAVLKFQAARGKWEPSVYPFVVLVEYSYNNAPFQPVPDHSLFICEKDSDDSLDAGKIVTYECEAFVPWLLRGALVSWSASSKDNKRTWVEPGRSDASAGWIMAGMLGESKADGWFPALSWDFTNTTTSSGGVWPNADKVNIPWDFSQTLFDVLSQLTADGLCDWTAEGTTLRLFRKDHLGADKSNVVLGGPVFERVPVKVDASGQYSHVRAAPEDMPWRNHTSNPPIRARFGHRSIMVAQPGVRSSVTSDRLVQPFVQDGAKVDREEAYEWSPKGGEVAPWVDFRQGDLVTGVARGGRQVRRVLGFVVRQDVAGATVQARVGEKVLRPGTVIGNKVSGSLMGGVSTGSGGSFPAAPTPRSLPPVAPSGLVVASNTASWSDQWISETTVELTWSPVTESVDGSEVDVDLYEVWSRPASGVSVRETATENPGTVITAWPGGVQRFVKVRARSVQGVWSAFTGEIPVTPAAPAPVTPKVPTGLAVSSNTAVFTDAGPVASVVFTWSPVTQTTGNAPLTGVKYEVLVDGILHTTVTATTVTIGVPTGVSRAVRVRAVAGNGATGDPTGALSVTGAAPAVVSLTPSNPVLSSGVGVCKARWDGLPTGIHAVRAQKQVSSVWVNQGAALTVAGTAVIDGNVGDTVQARFQAFDRLNRLIGTSATVTHTITGIQITDVSSAITDAINAAHNLAGNAKDIAELAQTSASQAYKLMRATTAPVGNGRNIDDTWEQWDTLGSGGKVLAFWRWNGTAWVKGEIAEAYLPLVNIGSGTYGSLAGQRLTASSVSTRSLMVADLTNLLNDAELQYPPTVSSDTTKGWYEIVSAPTVWAKVTDPAVGDGVFEYTATSTESRLANTNRFPIKGGDAFAYSIRYRSTLNGNAVLRMVRRTETGSLVSHVAVTSLPPTGGNWETITVRIAVPENVPVNVARADWELQIAPAVNTGKLAFTQPRLMRSATAELIVDGAVKARHVEMDEGFANKFWANDANIGRVTTDLLSSDVGSTLDIASNEAIILTAGRVDGLEDATDTLTAGVQSAGQQAANAASAAAIADGKALVAQNSVAAVSDQLAARAAVFKVVPTGAEVAAVDGTAAVRVTPAGITILQGGATASSWDGGRLIVNEAVLNRVQIGNHTAEKIGSTRTVWRPN